LAAWFAPGDASLAGELANSSDVINGLGVAMLGELGAGTASRARWIVRVILLLLMVPGADENDERTLVREFVAALLNAGRTT